MQPDWRLGCHFMTCGTIIVLGSGGRLGAAVARHFRRSGHEVLAFSRRDLDLADPAAVVKALGSKSFDALINCAAMTSVDECESNSGQARLVNAEAPSLLATICRERGSRLVHVSTDYVYDGTLPGLRSESDPAEPRSVYGRSKLEGERAVLAADSRFLVIRTSWVFGPDRPSFVDMIIDQARTRSRISAIADKISSPCYSLDFAEQVGSLLECPDAGGLVNLCCDGACTWQEYGQAAVDAAGACGLELRAHEVEPSRLDDMESFLAERPRFTAMATTRFTALTGIRPRPWREAVREYVEMHYVPRVQATSPED